MLICDKCGKEIMPYNEDYIKVVFMKRNNGMSLKTIYSNHFHMHCYTKVLIYIYPEPRTNHCTCNRYVSYSPDGTYVSARHMVRNSATSVKYHHLECFKKYYMIPIRDKLLC